jgi:hypothetical protein
MKVSLENVVNSGVGGGFVAASVVLETDKAVECHSLEVTLTGRVHCHWLNGKVGVKGEAELFKHLVVLVGRAAQDDDIGPGVLIREGRHEFAVHLGLPHCLPASLTAKFGQIEYLLKAVCYTKSMLSKNPTATLALDVLGSRWPRIEAAFQAPRAAAEEKKFFMSSAPCRATLQLNNPIAHVGSLLHGQIAVDNQSGKTVDAIGLKIVQLVTWRADNRNVYIVYSSNAAKLLLADSKVAPKSSRTIAFQLTIPASSHRPSVLTGTDCVASSQHFVCATVKVAFAADFEVRVPFLFTPTPAELAPSFVKPPTTTLIAPISVNPSLIAAMVDDGFEATQLVQMSAPVPQISAPVPVVVSRVGKRNERPQVADK